MQIIYSVESQVDHFGGICLLLTAHEMKKNPAHGGPGISLNAVPGEHAACALLPTCMFAQQNPRGCEQSHIAL
jgi:hypothetical protein